MFEGLLTKLYVAGENIAEKAHLKRRPSYDEVVNRILEKKNALYLETGRLDSYKTPGSDPAGLDLVLMETKETHSELMRDLQKVKSYQEFKDQKSEVKDSIVKSSELERLGKAMGYLKKAERQFKGSDSYRYGISDTSAAMAEESAMLRSNWENMEAMYAKLEGREPRQILQVLEDRPVLSTEKYVVSLRKYLRTSPASSMYSPAQNVKSGEVVLEQRALENASDSASLTQQLFDNYSMSTLSDTQVVNRALKQNIGTKVHKYFGVRRDRNFKQIADDLSLIREGASEDERKNIDAYILRAAQSVAGARKRFDAALKDMGYINGFSFAKPGDESAEPYYKVHLEHVTSDVRKMIHFYNMAMKREGGKKKGEMFDDLLGYNAVNEAMKKVLGKGMNPAKKGPEAMEDLVTALKHDENGVVKAAIRKVIEGYTTEIEIVERAMGSVYRKGDWFGKYDGSFVGIVGTVGDLKKFAGELYKARKDSPFYDPKPMDRNDWIYRTAKKVNGKINGKSVLDATDKVTEKLEGKQAKKNREEFIPPAPVIIDDKKKDIKSKESVPAATEPIQEKPWKTMPSDWKKPQ